MASVAYLPATVAPAGFTSSGLPVGVQIVGPQYGDHTCLAFARLLEQEYQAFVPPRVGNKNFKIGNIALSRDH